MYSSRTKASTAKINSTAVIVVSLLMAGFAVFGIVYAVVQFQASMQDFNTLVDQAGQGISACFNGTTTN